MTRPDGPKAPLILVVVDDAEAALNLGSTLSHFGYSLLFSRTIDDAIGVARAREPHLVISAFEILSRPAGVQLAHGIRRHLPDMPVLLLCDDVIHARRALESVPRVLTIPANAPPAELLVAISNLIQLQPHG